jgi:hypothetical protein
MATTAAGQGMAAGVAWVAAVDLEAAVPVAAALVAVVLAATAVAVTVDMAAAGDITERLESHGRRLFFSAPVSTNFSPRRGR